MKLAVTGSTGLVGNMLATRLANENLLLLGRTQPKRMSDGQFFKVDINSSSNYLDVLEGVEVVIHLAARVHTMGYTGDDSLDLYREVNTHGTENLARQAAKSGVKRFIFISSVKVNGESTRAGAPFSASDLQEPEDEYGLSKAEAENKLFQIGKQTGMEIVVIRPPLVYGPGVKANFASLMRLAEKGIPLPFGCISQNQRSLVSVENLVDLIVTCIKHPKAANEIFLVSDDNDVSTSQMARQMAISFEQTTRQLPVPVWCYQLAGKLLGKSDVVDRLVGSLQVDITYTKETLEWRPPQSLEDGFREAAQALINSKK
ncbi:MULTISPECIES: SDR family oxidoreductase [Vibrio]|uniref:UDP-glucose 4-epimerase family protein n=1 Tax=Vibrio TaxID=662 RepID=UPI0022AEFABF|nr:SDR family oxidoreductase [Vibrio atlanticus]MCZ4310109.1 SDR family oxidoreductase [Vibrio atlanticus]